MADGKMAHHWDLFAPLLCGVINPYMPKGKALRYENIHPYLQNVCEAKPHTKSNWAALKAKIKG